MGRLSSPAVIFRSGPKFADCFLAVRKDMMESGGQDFRKEADQVNYEIRTAGTDELGLVHHTMMLAFEEYRGRLHPPSGALSEDTETIRKKISEHGGGALLAWSGDKPVGSVQYYFRDSYLYVGRLSVIPEARGEGLGKAIMKHFEKLAVQHRYPEIRLGVRLSIQENIRFYRKLGYEIAEEHEYPERSDGWYIMRKRVEGGTA